MLGLIAPKSVELEQGLEQDSVINPVLSTHIAQDKLFTPHTHRASTAIPRLVVQVRIYCKNFSVDRQ